MRHYWDKWLVWCACMLVLGVFGCGSALLAEDSLDSDIARLKAQGVATTMAELVGPAVPDSENAALVYEKAFKGMSLCEGLKDFVSPKDKVVSPRVASQAKLLVAKYAGVMPLVEKAASLPKCRFTTDWTVHPLALDFDYFGGLKNLSLLVSSSAIIDAGSGKMDAAARKCELAIRMSGAQQREPGLAPLLVRLTLVHTACDGIYGCLKRGRMTESQCRRLFDALAYVKLNDHYALALQGERITGIRLFQEIAKGREGWAQLVGKDAADIDDAILASSGADDRELFFTTIQRLIDSAGLPSRDSKVKSLNLQLRTMSQARTFVSATLIPVFALVRVRIDGAIATAGATQLMLALNVYRQAKGIYPATIGQLKKAVAWKFQTDPFSGKDFIYKRTGKGYVLYSLGEDMKDNGGRVGATTKTGDLVWQINR